MLDFALRILLAHLLGDFLFQSDKWVEHKQTYQLKSKYLYYHILVHFLALIILLQFDIHYWLGVLIIVVSHFIIDVLKIKLKGRVNDRLLFFMDQIAHLLILIWVTSYYWPITFEIGNLISTKLLIGSSFLLAVTFVASVIMKVLISKWDLSSIQDVESLEKAGTYIGMLERLFVFGFVVLNHWEGIGFLLAAKSVFRFGDLSRSEDRKLTEYILIGTLLSFGLAILAGLGYTNFMKLIDL